MKKILLFAVILSAFGTAAQAQLPSFTLGVKGGVNLASLKAEGGWASEENRLGFQGGVWARLGATGFYVQPELYLAGKGGKFSSIQRITFEDGGKQNLTTLDLPVLVGNQIGLEKLNLRFMAGPIFSFLLKNDFKANADMVANFSDYKDQTIGVQAGTGVDLGNLSFDLRYEFGLSNISKSGQYEQKQRLWHLSLGYKLF
jgi:hypothetical protein